MNKRSRIAIAEESLNLHACPKALKVLLAVAKSLEPELPIKVDIEEGVFGCRSKTYVFCEQIKKFAGMDEIDGSCIVVYMR